MRVKRIVKPWRYPEASERQLGRSLSDFTTDLVVLARDQLDRIKFDADSDDIDDAEEELREESRKMIAPLLLALPVIAMRIYKFNSQQFIGVAKSAGGGNNDAVVILEALGAKAREPWYQEKATQWISMTKASYEKLANDIITDWSQTVRAENFKGADRDQIEEVIEQRYTIYTGWTVNRSRGIVATWNSVLMRMRLQDAGVTHYLWRGKLDERERLKHLLWEGERIGVDTDHVFPGEEYGCRCWAEPDFEGNENDDETTI